MTSKTQHAATLAAVLMNESHECSGKCELQNPRPETVAADALALIRIGNGVARWAVRACNGEGHRVNIPASGYQRWSWEWGSDDDAAKDKADARALAKLQAIADRYGAKVKLGGDPRGYVVKLILASGRHNTWGGAADGWGVA